MTLLLEGQANDYIGKGLLGGKVVRHPWSQLARAAEPQVILGNVALYGATSGFLFAAGSAGERFAIRNSGATAVVEGVGEHCCEYMTSGVVVILGATGRNFGAGMTGGVAYVWDLDGRFRSEPRFNSEFVEVHGLADCICGELARVHELVARHARLTDSRRAKQLLENWEHALLKILRVAPKAVEMPKPPAVA